MGAQGCCGTGVKGGGACQSLAAGLVLVAGPWVLCLQHLFADWCLLGRDGTHLPKGGEDIFVSSMAASQGRLSTKNGEGC